jgi:iron-regulated transporter 1
VQEHARARFSATEMALQNVFEMLSFASTIVFPLPGQFGYLVLISSGAVAVAAGCFAAYVRKERGHLLHRSKCMGGDKVLYRAVGSGEV